MTVAIPPVPTPVPQSTDPLNFDARADALLGSLPGVVSAMNAQNLENNAINAGLPALAVAAANAAPETILSTRTITDWNAITGTGWYMANAAANAPLSSDWFIGFAVVHNSEWQTQEAWAFVANSDEQHLRYRREKNFGIWSAWLRIYGTRDEILSFAAPLLYPEFPVSIYVGKDVGAGEAAIEIGRGRTGSGTAYIDLHAQPGVDYNARILRESGSDGNLKIENKGFGSVTVVINDIVLFLMNQSSRVSLFHSSNGLGYGAGSGGTVTQAISKSTAVTLNKPSGQIVLAASAIAAGTFDGFVFSNNTIAPSDSVVINFLGGGNVYDYELIAQPISGAATIYIKNRSAESLSQAVVIGYNVIKGSTT